MLNELWIRNQRGFTLIEMISVMIIMGVVASVAIQKFDMLSDTAAEQALSVGVRELNIRESLSWSNLKISSAEGPLRPRRAREPRRRYRAGWADRR